ncbi:MAG: putative addiction module antidote protein [Fibrobacteres bacterium]|nr:putative addiction module antidote protein [Fibrobacterota bacterium]
MKKQAIPFDISEYLDSEEMIAAYLSAIIEDNDWNLLLEAIGHIAKARGISKIAEESGLGRESLYKSLSAKSQPRFETIMKVLSAMHIKISITAEPTKKPRLKKMAAA